MSDLIRVMSNNQWKCDENKPKWQERGEDCSAQVRVKGLLRAYRQISPDIIGLQEASLQMVEMVMAGLNENGRVYELVSGRDTPIIFRNDLFNLVESGFYLYPETIPGLEGSFNNSETKSWCWCVLENRKTKKSMAVMSTHLWWKSGNPDSRYYQAGSAEARAWQIEKALTRLEQVMAAYKCPGLLMGDLNAGMDSLCLKKALGMAWQEVHDVCVGERDETKGHHPCSNEGYEPDAGEPFSMAIDHILVKNMDADAVQTFKRLKDAWFDPISDHYPLYVDLKM